MHMVSAYYRILHAQPSPPNENLAGSNMLHDLRVPKALPELSVEANQWKLPTAPRPFLNQQHPRENTPHPLCHCAMPILIQHTTDAQKWT